MRNFTIRAVCLMLVVVMLGAIMVSCKKDDEGGEATTTVEDAPEVTNLHQKLGMEIRDYSGQKMNIWYSYEEGNKWCAYPLKVALEDTETDIIYKAGYQRNAEMKARIGIEMVYTVNEGNPINDAEPLRLLRQSGDIGKYDLVLTSSKSAGPLALEDFYVDLELSPYINEEEFYYEAKINKQVKIGKHQYFAAGYYSWGNIAATEMAWANMKILENENATTKEKLYQMAFDKKLTLDKMLEIGRCNYVPENDNSKWESAKVSLILSYYRSASPYFNMGGKIVEYNESQNTYESVVKNGDNPNKLAYLHEKLRDNPEVLMIKEHNEMKAFLGGAAPFILQPLDYIEELLADEISKKVIFLPAPLYEEGDEYNSYCNSESLSMAGIPIDTAVDPDKFDKAGYLYEFFMIASYETVYPAIYEKSFKTRYQPDETSREVFELCQKAKTIDLAPMYSLYGTTYISAAVRESGSVATFTAQIHTAVKSNLKDVNAKAAT